MTIDLDDIFGHASTADNPFTAASPQQENDRLRTPRSVGEQDPSDWTDFFTNAWFDLIDPPDPCPECGTLELWLPAAGDLFGKTPARWRCRRCDPPTAARRLRGTA